MCWWRAPCFWRSSLALIVAERAHWIRRPSADDLTESVANIGTGFLQKMLAGLFAAGVIALFFNDVRAWGLQFTPSQPWVGWLVLFVVTDFLFYVAHFVLHKVRDGWCSHITHHSPTRYNPSTALRQSFLFDLSSLAALWWVPLALVGLDKLSVIVAVELKLFYQFFVHTEVAGRLPNWFEAIFNINTPSHHRAHHGRNAAQIDTNVGGVLIIRDCLFGTFVDERNAGKIVYGVSHRQPTMLNRLRLNLGERIAMWRDV